MIVTMAMLTTMAMPPMLRSALARLPMSEGEKKRIERERLDERGFVPNLERLLLAVDAGAAGRMAARLAGLLAGGHGMPVTILKLETDLREKPAPAVRRNEAERSVEDEKQQKHELAARPGDKDTERKDISGAVSVTESPAEQSADPVAREVKTGAKASAAKVIRDDAEPNPDKVHLTTRVPVDKASEVVRDEARKGYDLLFIGMEDVHDADGNFFPEITELASGFDGPLAILAGAGGKTHRLTARSRILLPVNGSPASRRAAEVSFVLARATGARVSALYVSQTDGRSRTRLREEGVLKDMAELAERYGARLVTRISKRGAAADAILKDAGSGYDLLVMGVNPRPGEELFFGNTAATVLRGWKSGPCLFLAS
jgi:nucleotide-binding universal stress UspA family protein